MDTATPGTTRSPPLVGQRRYLTVLFTDLSDSTRLGDSMEAELYVELLDAFRQLCRRIVAHHGGRIARLQGDGALAVFGDPQPQEDDGRRAVEAALQLHAAVRALDLPAVKAASRALSMHSGIHAGLAFYLEGDVERGRLEVLGSVPNFAARLCDLAAPGEICVSEEALGPLRHFFATTDTQLVSIKGRAAPLSVLRVLGRTGLRRRFEASGRQGSGPLTGRQRELAVLQAELSPARAPGRGRRVAIVGGPGLGKTRLIEEFLRLGGTSSARTLRGYCEAYLGAEPLQPFVQMVRELVAAPLVQPAEDDHKAMRDRLLALGVADAAHREALLRLLGAAPGPAGGISDPVPALQSLLATLSARQPLLLTIDDWQWADEASQQVLAQLPTGTLPLFVLLASRPEATESWLHRCDAVVALDTLDAAATALAARHLLPGADPFVVGQIARHAGGNPLFIEEMCHWAASDEAARSEQPPAGAAWLHALVESRVGRLPPVQRDVLRAAAVLGNVFPVWLLHALTGFGEHDPDLHALSQEDFLYPGTQPGTLRFKHGLTRDAVYRVVGLHERRALHLRAAAALAGGADGVADDLAHEALAYHYGAGGAWAEAAHHAERAGDRAMASLALDRVRSQYGAALEALDRLTPLSREQMLRWAEIAQKLGMACVYDPLGLPGGVATFERAAALASEAGDAQTAARSEYWLGYVCYAKGLSRRAVAHCEKALAQAHRIDDQRLAAQVAATLGQASAATGDYARALTLLDAAVGTKRQQVRTGSSVAVGSAYSLSCKGQVLGDQGRFDEAQACFGESLLLLGPAQHQVGASVRGWISLVFQWQGRWEDALRHAVDAADIAEQVRSRHLLAMNRGLAGYARWRRDGDAAALQQLRDAAAWIEARQGAFFVSLLHGWIVESACALGRTAEARRHAARLLLRARQHDRLGEAMGCRAMAAAAADAGDPRRAARWLGRAQRSARDRGSRHEQAKNLLCAAALADAAGDPDAAASHRAEARALFDAMAMPADAAPPGVMGRV